MMVYGGQGRGATAPLILNFCITCRRVVKFRLQPLHLREAGWALETVCTVLVYRNFLAPTGIRTQNRPARSWTLFSRHVNKNKLLLVVVVVAAVVVAAE
jgi:hypothetical protein